MGMERVRSVLHRSSPSNRQITIQTELLLFGNDPDEHESAKRDYNTFVRVCGSDTPPRARLRRGTALLARVRTRLPGGIQESSFARVRLRQWVIKGAGSRSKGLTMAFKLLAMAQGRLRKQNGYSPLPLVQEGVQFVDGEQETIHEESAAKRLAMLGAIHNI